MRILLIAFDYRPRVGGVSTCSYELASALSKEENIEIKVLAPKQPGDKEFDNHNLFETKRINVPQRSYTAIPSLFFEIFSETKNYKPDLIINMLWMPEAIATYFSSLFTKVPYTVVAHGVEILETRSSLKKRIRAKLSPLKSLVLSKASHVYPVSNYTKLKVLEGTNVSEKKVHVIKNGVNPVEFSQTDDIERIKQRHNITNQKVFITITRLVPHKGVDKAIEAFAKVRDKNFKYLIGGTGPYRSYLEELVKVYKLEEQIIFLGRVSDEDLKSYYSAADMLVLLSRFEPNIPSVEGFGLVFLEAAACGTPSLAGRSGGIEDAVIDGETGILVDPTNTKDISIKLEGVISGSTDLQKLSVASKEHAIKNMTWSHMAKRLLETL